MFMADSHHVGALERQDVTVVPILRANTLENVLILIVTGNKSLLDSKPSHMTQTTAFRKQVYTLSIC